MHSSACPAEPVRFSQSCKIPDSPAEAGLSTAAGAEWLALAGLGLEHTSPANTT